LIAPTYPKAADGFQAFSDGAGQHPLARKRCTSTLKTPAPDLVSNIGLDRPSDFHSQNNDLEDLASKLRR
jgi:hypothetical protein